MERDGLGAGFGGGADGLGDEVEDLEVDDEGKAEDSDDRAAGDGRTALDRRRCRGAGVGAEKNDAGRASGAAGGASGAAGRAPGAAGRASGAVGGAGVEERGGGTGRPGRCLVLIHGGSDITSAAE